MSVRFCFLDMDGVLADFVGGICRAHGRSTPYDDPHSYGIFDMEKLWGMSIEEFWSPPKEDLGMEFWSGLAKTPEADQIVELAVRYFGTKNTCILTSPSQHPSCVPGKRVWMKQHYPKLANNILFGSAKRFLAGPDRVLIDDRDKNVEEFKKYGGHAIRVPRAWNMGWPERNVAVKVVDVELLRLRTGLGGSSNALR